MPLFICFNEFKKWIDNGDIILLNSLFKPCPRNLLVEMLLQIDVKCVIIQFLDYFTVDGQVLDKCIVPDTFIIKVFSDIV